MANPHLTIPASTLFTRENGTTMATLTATITVTGMRRFRARVWLAGYLLRLTAWILGTGLQIDVVAGKRW